jgi:hypothetical protein
MSSAVVEELLEEAKALPPDEQRQLRDLLSDENLKGILQFLLVAGLVYLIKKTNDPPPEERRRLDDLLVLLAIEMGVMSRAEFVHSLRGKYAHLQIGSEEFAAQKREEIRLEDRR